MQPIEVNEIFAVSLFKAIRHRWLEEILLAWTEAGVTVVTYACLPGSNLGEMEDRSSFRQDEV